MQEPLGSQTSGARQSSTDWQRVAQTPDGWHRYGVQSVFWPFAPVVVWSPSQLAPATHRWLATSHVFPVTQSVSALHDVKQAASRHTNEPQGTGSGARHVPLPLQMPGAKAVLPSHVAAPHATFAPANPAHDFGSLPSQLAAAHGFFPSPPAQAARRPWGLPLTGVHVPSAFSTSHASHCPSHATLQQNPSTQCPVAHSSEVEHARPPGFLTTHTPPLQ